MVVSTRYLAKVVRHETRWLLYDVSIAVWYSSVSSSSLDDSNAYTMMVDSRPLNVEQVSLLARVAPRTSSVTNIAPCDSSDIT